MSKNTWIGFDLDGTLAYYEHGSFPEIGEPIPESVELVKMLLAKGHQVKIVTARVGPQDRQDDEDVIYDQKLLICNWCIKHIGQTLEVTHSKDFSMWFLVDDRCVAVLSNRGALIDPNSYLAEALSESNEIQH